MQVNKVNKYKKLPVEIEAIKFTKESIQECTSWLGNSLVWSEDEDSEEYPALYINTLEGIMKASEGDYIIKGIYGEFYPCREDIFNQSYEPSN